MSEIRFDRLHNRYVIIAPEREHRPNLPHREMLTSSKKCPFCEGNEALTPPEIFAMRENEPNTKGWKTRVVPNLYKAVQIETQLDSHRNGMFESLNGFGAHEVIIDTPCHTCTLSDVGSDVIENWLRTMIVRIQDLQKDKRLVSVNLFKNSGKAAGATQQHPHTQLIALPMMPEVQLLFLQRNQAYYHLHGRGLVEDIVANEVQEQQRVVTQNQNFLAYCPYASFFAFEVIVAPMRPIALFSSCSREELRELAVLLEDVFKRLQRELGSYDYNMNFYMAPINENFDNEVYMKDIEKNFTFYVRIMPRIYTLGGFEIANDMAMNSVLPELAAKLLQGDR